MVEVRLDGRAIFILHPAMFETRDFYNSVHPNSNHLGSSVRYISLGMQLFSFLLSLGVSSLAFRIALGKVTRLACICENLSC